MVTSHDQKVALKRALIRARGAYTEALVTFALGSDLARGFDTACEETEAWLRTQEGRLLDEAVAIQGRGRE